MKMKVVISGDDAEKESRKLLAMTGAKSLCDALRREARGIIPRVATAVGEVKQSLVAAKGSMQWCPHTVMMADPLTKAIAQSQSTASAQKYEV